LKPYNLNLFLDSGAYGAASKNFVINIQEYISFIKENLDKIAIYANLDVIGDAEATLINQKIMEEAGLSPIPCYHYGEDIKYLEYYLSYPYIALGGVAGRMMTPQELMNWLDILFRGHICDKQGYPKMKVHGFGITSHQIMFRYPWYSVDSTAWLQYSAFGSILVPQFRNENYDYSLPPWRVFVSVESPHQRESGKHFETFPLQEQKFISDYVKKIGVDWGETEGKLYEEIKVIKRGVTNHHEKRERVNLIYYQNLVKTFPKWPWSLKIGKFKRQEGFFG
jgi:hypothetical protein